MAHDAAAKGGVITLTKSLANEYAPHGITVNNVPPSSIDTPMSRQSQAASRLGSPEQLAKLIPLGHMGSPDDIAAAAGFLCSDEAGFHHRPGARRQRRRGDVTIRDQALTSSGWNLAAIRRNPSRQSTVLPVPMS